MAERIMLFPQLVKMATAPQLIGCRCPECNLYYFPIRRVCPHCFLEGLVQCLLSNLGKVKNFTIVHAKPPKGFPSPYAVGYVELIQEGLVIPSIITADDLHNLENGMPARLVVEPLSNDDEEGKDMLVYKFKTGE